MQYGVVVVVVVVNIIFVDFDSRVEKQDEGVVLGVCIYMGVPIN